MTSELPAFGGRRLTPNSTGDYTTTELPVEQPSNDEHRAFTNAGYYTLSRLELMQRLRGAEWDAVEWKRQLDEHRAGARYQRTADARALARVAGLVDHHRKTLRMWDLRCALGLIPWEQQQASEPDTTT